MDKEYIINNCVLCLLNICEDGFTKSLSRKINNGNKRVAEFIPKAIPKSMSMTARANTLKLHTDIFI